MKKPVWWTDLLSASMVCLLFGLLFDGLFWMFAAGSLLFLIHHIAVRLLFENFMRGRKGENDNGIGKGY
jgi:hypothetical protein